MEVVLLMLITFFGYWLAYRTYGQFLARRVFRLHPDGDVPSVFRRDGVDFVPAAKEIIFGHHYTSIAGTGPIVGPAIGIIWGWIPALLWVFLGSIFMGAVHDFGALVLSMRSEGESISDVAARYVNRRVRYIFFLVIFLVLLIVIAIFGLVIAIIFGIFPQSVVPVWAEIPIALALGWFLYKRGGGLVAGTLGAVTAMYATVVLGHFLPVSMPEEVGGIPSTGVWTIILLAYAFVASTIPVDRLLQPRDYINAWQLFIAMGLLILGVLTSGLGGNLEMVAPAYNPAAGGAPPLWPFLFITIACGACSGFHSLISSGTSSKQISREPDALFVGYGSMMFEAVLATLVLIAVAAGIGIAYKTGDGSVLSGSTAWQEHYASWEASSGLGSKVDAVVIGSANMMEGIFIPKELGIVIIGVFIASFAATTLDSATRVQRYVVTELFRDVGIPQLTNRYLVTALAVLTAAGVAFSTGADGSGAMKLWPMFGAVNQLLAALALLVITLYLRHRGAGFKMLVAGLPCLIMLALTIWAVCLNEVRFIGEEKGLLSVINGAVLLLSLWMVAESVAVLFKKEPKGSAAT